MEPPVETSCVNLQLPEVDLLSKLALFKAQNEYAAKLVQKHGWHFIYALRFANDYFSQQQADQIAREKNLPRARCVQYVGSHHRLAYALRVMPRARLIAQLPTLWRDSDPDDTKKIYLELWREWAKKYQPRLYDLRPLPKGSDYLEIYRGQRYGQRFGISWTLDAQVAVRFAKQAAINLNRRAGLYCATVPRERVLCYLAGRGEAEAIIDSVSDYKPRCLYIYQWG